MQDAGVGGKIRNARSLSRTLYGRRVGRSLTTGQTDLLAAKLPELRVDISGLPPRSLTDLFSASVEDVWLEIGFGGGEHLLWQANAYPKIGFIGCEPFLNGVVKAIRGMEDGGLRSIRLYDDDARHLLNWLPEESLGRVFVFFPDPWPKKRHRKRRLLSRDGLALIAGAMRRGAELRFATDIADYADMVHDGIDASGDFRSRPGLLAERPPDWPLTRYAEKAIGAGRICRFFVFERI